MSTTHADPIEKKILLRAPRSPICRPLTNTEEFGTWFGVKLTSQFAHGARVHGSVTLKGYEHVDWNATIETIEPETLFSFRWHPYAVDLNVDYSHEPTTLITFQLEEVEGGTM